mmetsp:Transcript_22959/g.55607  ORF Transcript_22959/g.55607 Transcript_22959/m.55607 type:complete len:238 (+) Transcript_22959:309-1022(+)
MKAWDPWARPCSLTSRRPRHSLCCSPPDNPVQTRVNGICNPTVRRIRSRTPSGTGYPYSRFVLTLADSRTYGRWGRKKHAASGGSWQLPCEVFHRFAQTRRKDVLPDPLGPRTKHRCPGATFMSSPETMTFPPAYSGSAMLAAAIVNASVGAPRSSRGSCSAATASSSRCMSPWASARCLKQEKVSKIPRIALISKWSTTVMSLTGESRSISGMVAMTAYTVPHWRTNVVFTKSYTN